MGRVYVTTVGAGRRVAAAGLVALLAGCGVVALLAGCGVAEPDGYEPALRYPARVDPVVVRVPAAEPAGLPPPGKLDASIAALAAGGGEFADPTELPLADRERLTQCVEHLFGTPAAPRVAHSEASGGFDLSADNLAAGSRVYKRLCANCHGMSGDGRGPVGPWSYPYPRDFRAGAFKVAVGAAKPTPDQLARLLRQGVSGSSMPVFDLLSDAEVRAVSGYVVHLSLRGEVEAAGVRAGADGDDVSAAVERASLVAVDRWDTPPAVGTAVAVLEPAAPGYADAVRRGRELFGSSAAGCASCHQDYGRTEAFRYDVWGAPVRVPDLTRGEFRWGRDDATLAARIRHGIPASGMPASPLLSERAVGDLVSFVRDVGLPGRLPPDVRADVYPQAARR